MDQKGQQRVPHSSSRRRAHQQAALVMLLTLTGCLGDFLTTPSRRGSQPAVIRRLVVTPESASLDAFGRTATFTAGWWESGSVTPASGCKWAVSGETVATLADEDGTVRARGNGQAVVRATCGDTTATAAVGVWQAVAAVWVNPGELDLAMGESGAMTAQARDGNDNPLQRPVTFSWASSDEFVVQVAADPDHPEQARATRYFPGRAYVEARAEGRTAKTKIE